MKRNNRKKRNRIKAVKGTIKYYPIIFCQNENICIAISKKEMKFKSDKFGRITTKHKVLKKHWDNKNSLYRSDEYCIDFEDKKNGDLIYCPKCKSLVDFRLFPSSSVPKFVSLK